MLGQGIDFIIPDSYSYKCQALEIMLHLFFKHKSALEIRIILKDKAFNSKGIWLAVNIGKGAPQKTENPEIIVVPIESKILDGDWFSLKINLWKTLNMIKNIDNDFYDWDSFNLERIRLRGTLWIKKIDIYVLE